MLFSVSRLNTILISPSIISFLHVFHISPIPLLALRFISIRIVYSTMHSRRSINGHANGLSGYQRVSVAARQLLLQYYKLMPRRSKPCHALQQRSVEDTNRAHNCVTSITCKTQRITLF